MTTFLSDLPVSSLAGRLGLPEREAGRLVETLRRLGIGTLGELAALSPDHVADRFGPTGMRALRLARGEEELLVRTVHGAWGELVEEIELPEGTAGSRLERALELLVDRLLAAPGRKGRTLLGIRLGALLGDGGSGSVAQGLGRPTASARALRGVLLPRLEELPAPGAGWSAAKARSTSSSPRSRSCIAPSWTRSRRPATASAVADPNRQNVRTRRRCRLIGINLEKNG